MRIKRVTSPLPSRTVDALERAIAQYKICFGEKPRCVLIHPDGSITCADRRVQPRRTLEHEA